MGPHLGAEARLAGPVTALCQTTVSVEKMSQPAPAPQAGLSNQYFYNGWPVGRLEAIAVGPGSAARGRPWIPSQTRSHGCLF